MGERPVAGFAYAHNNLGGSAGPRVTALLSNLLQESDRLEEAEVHYREAIASEPGAIRLCPEWEFPCV